MKSLTYVEIDVPAFEGGSPPDLVTYRFAVPTNYLPQEIEAIPSLAGVSITPATISLGKDLGLRATVNASFIDHLHIMNGEPYDQGTFWGKWRGRYGEKLRGRSFRLIRGVLGQPLSSMETRHFVVDATDGPSPDGVYTITAKDVLKLADNDRAQAPQLSNGSLAGSINSSTTSATLNPVGIGDLEYPASGWITIGGKEVVAFTRVADVLTITRGQFGSIAQAHDAGDRMQLVLRYTGDDPADIIADLLEDYAGVPGAYIPLAEWQAETAEYLGVIYARTITEPTSVNKLVSELVEQAALAVWWDDLAQLMRLRVLREISTDAETFDFSRIIAGSFQVTSQPNERISQIWSYYGQRDPTDQSDNADNYRAALATVDLQRETEYGSAEIRKILASWVETETAATRLNSIQLSRFRDPPRRFEFSLFKDAVVSPANGYTVRWWGNQDESGVEIPAAIQITRIRFEADMIHIEAEEMLASGVIVLVNVVFLLTTGSLLQWEVPASWNDADNSVEAIGAGGGGGANTGDGGAGGAGGGYSRVENITLAPAALIDYRIGAGGAGATIDTTSDGDDGEDTWFGASTIGASTVGAKGGTGGGPGRTSPGTGGAAASGVGTLKTSGGDGGNGAPQGETRSGGGGGGGGGGPNGNGAQGRDLSSTSQDGGGGGGGADGGVIGNGSSGATGGDGGNNRFGFGGGTDTQPTGQEGGAGRGGNRDNSGAAGGAGEQMWTQTVAPIISAGPGGGGGGGGDRRHGGSGGNYGGGGGGSGENGGGGAGAPGIIVIRWREVV